DGQDDEVGALEVRAMLDVTEAVRSSGLELEQVEMLVATYGRRAGAVLDAARRLPGGTERLCKNAPEILAQLHWAVESELAVSLQDVLLRRTGLGTGPCLGLDCAPAIAQRMGALLGWSPRRVEAELDAYDATVRQGLRFRGEGPRRAGVTGRGYDGRRTRARHLRRTIRNPGGASHNAMGTLGSPPVHTSRGRT